MSRADDFLRIGQHVRVLPLIHGSGDFAVCVREELLAPPCDCLAVPLPPASWRRLAWRFGRKLAHLPLECFSGQLLERLRRLHVLNGKQVRSYAAEFIRDS